jgi:glycosyltransferase involved in cell wall biosynthesis
VGNINISETADFMVNEPLLKDVSIAVLIPCYNEELTIADVVHQFRAQLPSANIYVFDNNSTDKTIEQATLAGAIVLKERRQGKGYVVQSMFRQIDADIYVMVDGDGTYPPEAVHRLIAPVLHREADMVVGTRLHTDSQSQFKVLNRFGNHLFLSVLNSIFSVKLSDILSGYRVFNRKFVKGIPIFGGGFEIETELTIKAVERGYQIVEIPVNLGVRPEGSFSKIHIIRDGVNILNTILALFRDYKPLTFFGVGGLCMIIAGLLLGWMVTLEFIRTGLVTHLPSAVLAVGLVLSGMLLIIVGLILHTVTRRSQEFEHQIRVLVEQLNLKNSRTEDLQPIEPQIRSKVATF